MNLHIIFTRYKDDFSHKKSQEKKKHIIKMKLKHFKVRKKSFQTRNHPSNLLQGQKRRRKHPSRLPFQPTAKGQKF